MGIGLRSQHVQEILRERPKVSHFEMLVDNYLHAGKRQIENLLKIREDYSFTLHCVGMNLGGADPLNKEYFQQVKSFAELVDSQVISDHLAWTAHQGFHHHDLLPLAYTEETLQRCVQRVCEIQDLLQLPLAVENPSTYLTFNSDTINEADFLARLAKEADCELLLDVNNVFVNASNHGFSATAFLECLPKEKVTQYHLAGYEDHGEYLLDSHGACVSNQVWDLYRKTVKLIGNKPVTIEWDANVPELQVLLAEAERAEEVIREQTS